MVVDEELKVENARLRKENEVLKALLASEGPNAVSNAEAGSPLSSLEQLAEKSLTIVVVGASGDLAKKKTYPSLYSLFRQDILPSHVEIVGYARSTLTKEQFHEKISPKLLPEEANKKQKFLDKCTYFAGSYDDDNAFANLNGYLESLEKNESNRLFYFAIPPNVFGSTAVGLKKNCITSSGWNRVIVEKPFGMDSASSAELSKTLLDQFREDQIYRIDHYLGKEMVQNLMTLRFANTIFEPVWNSQFIDSVTITFKENIGTQGRGGYFDKFGIIRDVMQNHLTQVLSLIAMESPVLLNAEEIRNEKVKVLKAIRPATLNQAVVGQYLADENGKEEGYLDDPGVPNDSVTPTFAMLVLFIKNRRWEGVPFILKAGKALNERKAEIRIQFKPPGGELYGLDDVNELVMRVQPNEAIYAKFFAKKPGLADEIEMTELDLTFKRRFSIQPPDAYERLIYDALRGDHNLFVRNDELSAAWDIFTPILHQIDEAKAKPIPYKFGSRGPKEADELAKKMGFKRTMHYSYPSHL